MAKKVPCERYSRIVGYLRPLQNWNKAKKQEWEDRRPYGLPSKEELNDPKGTVGRSPDQSA